MPCSGRGGLGTAALPQLVSELAVRAADQPNQSHYVVITPDRHLDLVGQSRHAGDPGDREAQDWSEARCRCARPASVLPTDRGASGAADPNREISAAVVGQAVAAASFADSFRSALPKLTR